MRDTHRECKPLLTQPRAISPTNALAILKRMDPRALRALIKADEFNEMVAGSPWPSSISEMIAKGWSYPNGENFTPEAWARLAQHDKGTRSLFVVCGPEGVTLWAPFFAAEAGRRGLPVTALEEELIAHVGTRYVKTGRGARSTCFGIDVKRVREFDSCRRALRRQNCRTRRMRWS